MVVFLTDALSSANRQRLIQQGVNFIVPGNQLFLPELGADLREYFRSEVRLAVEKLTPAAQVVVLASLLREDLDGQTPKSLAERFQYSAMSTGRVVDELQRHGILSIDVRGRERRIAFKQEGDDRWPENPLCRITPSSVLPFMKPGRSPHVSGRGWSTNTTFSRPTIVTRKPSASKPGLTIPVCFAITDPSWIASPCI